MAAFRRVGTTKATVYERGMQAKANATEQDLATAPPLDHVVHAWLVALQATAYDAESGQKPMCLQHSS